MANAGFSAPVNYWGSISGLTPKSSSDGATSSVAEAPNSYGDTVAHDVYGEVIAPSTEYAVTGTVDLSAIALGSVVQYSSSTYIMMTSVTVNTSAGASPTVTIAGVQVESNASAKRVYSCVGTLTPRSKAQDVASALTASDKFTQINTTFSVDPHVETVDGTPVASDCAHGRIEVQATMTDYDGSGSITAASGGGFTVTASPAETNPDAGYITIAATATKYITGTETNGANYVYATFTDGLGSVIVSTRLTSGSTPTPPADPTRTGYTFAGWSPAVGAITANTVYNATWTEE